MEKVSSFPGRIPATRSTLHHPNSRMENKYQVVGSVPNLTEKRYGCGRLETPMTSTMAHQSFPLPRESSNLKESDKLENFLPRN